jgi:hypothetical protein
MLGDLPGHIFPGLAYIAWAIVWALALRRRPGAPWSSQPDAALASDFASTGSLETWAKILIPLAEMAGELRWVTWPMTDASATIYGHITADVAVIVSGVVDLLVRRARLPVGSDRIALALAFFVPGILFVTHGQHGSVATVSHEIFGRLLLLTALLVVLGMFRAAPVIAWLRVYAVALAGAWFIHTGWMIYVSGMDLMSPMMAPRVYLAFTWYAIGCLLVLLFVLAPRASRREASGGP